MVETCRISDPHPSTTTALHGAAPEDDSEITVCRAEMLTGTNGFHHVTAIFQELTLLTVVLRIQLRRWLQSIKHLGTALVYIFLCGL